MQTITPVSNRDGTSQITLASHTQAVERAIQVMHTHLPEALTLEDLASVACLSPFHFNRVFRRLIGIPPVEFLAGLRFQTARRLLLTTPLSVTDICFEVGYNSLGSFTSRFTQLVGLTPRLLRQQANRFTLPLPEQPVHEAAIPGRVQMKSTLVGRVSAPTVFRGTIFLGLFTRPIPQGRPVRCTRLGSPGWYQLNNIPDGVYYLLTAAFPAATDPLFPNHSILVGKNASSLVVHKGRVFGDPDIVLRPPRLTDPPLVMALPLPQNGKNRQAD